MVKIIDREQINNDVGREIPHREKDWEKRVVAPGSQYDGNRKNDKNDIKTSKNLY